VNAIELVLRLNKYIRNHWLFSAALLAKLHSKYVINYFDDIKFYLYFVKNWDISSLIRVLEVAELFIN